MLSSTLTHISLASFLWDIGKQHSPRCDATEHGIPSGAILFAQRKFIEKVNKMKISLDAPKSESGPIQKIVMGESIHHIWAKIIVELLHEKNNNPPMRKQRHRSAVQ